MRKINYNSVITHLNRKSIFGNSLFDRRLSDDAVLSKSNKMHVKWLERLESDLYEIWEWEKVGSMAAHEYMRESKTQAQLVNLRLWFFDRDTHYNRLVTYGKYRKVREETDNYLRRIKKELREDGVAI